VVDVDDDRGGDRGDQHAAACARDERGGDGGGDRRVLERIAVDPRPPERP
jgi:hypothetical protein